MSTKDKIPIWLSTENQNIDIINPKIPIIKLENFKFNLLGTKLIKEYCDGIKFETKLVEIEATIIKSKAVIVTVSYTHLTLPTTTIV